MGVHKFSTSPFKATFAFLQHQLLPKGCFSSAGLTVSELRIILSGEDLEALNVMHCNKVVLQLSKSLNNFFLNIGGSCLVVHFFSKLNSFKTE